MDDHRGAQITGLVTRASTGDKQAWDALVDRYAPLIWSICGRYRLSRADAEDVGQSVWLRLTGQLDKIRDPAALPGWLATTTRLGIPVGSIGPKRRRCLDRLRRDPALTALINAADAA